MSLNELRLAKRLSPEPAGAQQSLLAVCPVY
jgi:hypothetical protein